MIMRLCVAFTTFTLAACSTVGDRAPESSFINDVHDSRSVMCTEMVKTYMETHNPDVWDSYVAFCNEE